MNKFQPGIDKDRRKGPDLVSRAVTWIAVLGWLLMVIVLIMLDQASPEVENFFQFLDSYNSGIRLTWNETIVGYIFYLMIAGFIMAVSGFLISLYRNRRRSDSVRISLVFLGIISLFGIIRYLWVH